MWCVVVEVLWEVSKEMPVSWAEGILAGCSTLVPPPWVQHGIPKFWGQLAAPQSHTQPQELSLPGLSPLQRQELSPVQPVMLQSGAWHLSRRLRSLKLRACFTMVDPLLVMPQLFHVAHYRQFKQRWAGLAPLCSPVSPRQQQPLPSGGLDSWWPQH